MISKHKSTREVIAALALLMCVRLAMRSTAQVRDTLPNTGMADPVALMNAFDRFVAGGIRTSLAIPLVSLRGFTSEGLNAGGRVTIDLNTGSINSQIRGLPIGAAFDLWLIDNREASGHTTLAEAHDLTIKVGAYAEQSGTYSLSLSLGGQAFAGFFPDRAFVVRSGQSPSIGFVLTGSASMLDRLARRQVRFVDDSGAARGFDPLAQSTRSAQFAKLIAQGRRLFLRETFAGNERTCGTCHVESNNFTIDPPFIASLPGSDPLFVAETIPALAGLENPDLMRRFGLFGVHADGFNRPMLFRATQNVQALANSSVRPDPSFGGDFTTNGRNPDPPERLGWGNDGAPLRDFALVAIAQHAPKALTRIPGQDFRTPTDEELDALVAYQLPLGRQEDFDLPTLQLSSAVARTGKSLYLDSGNLNEPGHKNCNGCHFNGGGTGAFSFNPLKPGFPRLDGSPHGGNIAAATNVNETPRALMLGLPRDGGFGQKILPPLGSFGNDADPPAVGHLDVEEFNSGPVVESADTIPLFHNHTVGTLEESVAFYGTPAFQNGVFSKFGVITVSISSDPNDSEVQAISVFLRVLNALENIRSAINVAARGREMSNLADARDLAGLALAECQDAIQVLTGGALATNNEASILSARVRLLEAQTKLDTARQPTSSISVSTLLEDAMQRLRAARSELASPATLPPSFRN